MTITSIRAGTAQKSTNDALSHEVMSLVNKQGLDVLSKLGKFDEKKASPGLKAALEKFAAILNNDTATYGTISAGGEQVIVALDNDFDNNREIVQFFDKAGQSLGRAFTLYEKDVMTMAWSKNGQPGAPIASAPIQKVNVPSSFKKDLEAYADKKQEDGEDFGKDIATKDLPPPVRHRMEMMERTIADPTGAQTFKLNGVTVYMLGDYSCVSSQYFVTADGKKHYEIVG